uniref:Uncharacterized protein n=1 Tax=Panagrolaimus sp. PS1159 TaxID=55785 RepID=A0AC35GQT6_9BILA
MSLVIPSFGNECRIRMKWKLKEDYLKDALKNLGEDFIQSEVYNASNIPGVKYSLFLKYFDGDLVGIYFYLVFNMVKEIHASFIVSVKSAQYEVKEEFIYPKTTSLGNELCSIEESSSILQTTL